MGENDLSICIHDPDWLKVTNDPRYPHLPVQRGSTRRHNHEVDTGDIDR